MRVVNSLFQNYELNVGKLAERSPPASKIIGVVTGALGILAIASGGGYSHSLSRGFQCLAIQTGLSINYFQSTTFICALVNTIISPSGAINGSVVAGGLLGALGHSKLGYTYARSAGLAIAIGMMYDTFFSENPAVSKPSGPSIVVATIVPVIFIGSWAVYGGIISLFTIIGKCSAVAVECAASSVIKATKSH
ncbi:MAG: hypothetical protein K1000chlam2_01050 [Chlamydiae bacterium]|nr:hypothetical protein [Chlamydiota bacterium]